LAVLRKLICALLLVLVMSIGSEGKLPVDLAELGLEELMEIEIVSVLEKEETLFETAVGVYVVTGEEIRRFGVTTTFGRDETEELPRALDRPAE